MIFFLVVAGQQAEQPLLKGTLETTFEGRE